MPVVLPRSPRTRIRERDARIVVVAIGDSITEGSPEHDARRGGDVQSQWEYWAARVYSWLEFRNCGRYGERTDEILARFEECVRDADALVVQAGINDIAQSRPIVDAARNLQQMIRRGKDLGLGVAVADVLPWNNGTRAQARAIRELNALIAEIANDEGVSLLPFHDTLVDPDDADRMQAEWTHADGDHPSVAGYRRLGELAFRVPT
jgi:lysophospholipase L1-like esterase